MTTTQRVARARAFTDSEVVRQLVAQRTRTNGRPRKISLHAVMAALAMHGVSRPGTACIAAVVETLRTLSASDLAVLGFRSQKQITYRRMLSGIHA
ncbi:hypothetical protein [Cellulomonas terrae]|nr:hypothetical protein [Cellulomonas terrae]